MCHIVSRHVRHSDQALLPFIVSQILKSSITFTGGAPKPSSSTSRRGNWVHFTRLCPISQPQMAAHHHHDVYGGHTLNSHPIITTAAATATTSCCCCSSFHQPPSPDPLLHSLGFQFLHPTPQPQLYSPPYAAAVVHHHQTQHCQPQIHQQNSQLLRTHRQQQEEQQIHPVVSSLIDRISALESAFRRRSSSGSYAIRDAAARTIQTHFRAFLVRRSRTLRHLKDLAAIKSTLNTLKSSVSESSRFDSQALHRKSVDLLIRLDSIQGDDPMIRDGKRSISRELIRFMDFINAATMKTHELSNRVAKSSRSGCNGDKTRVLYSRTKIATSESDDMGDVRESVKKLRGRIEKIGKVSRVSMEDDDDEDEELQNPRIPTNGSRIHGLLKRHGDTQAKVKKSVTFAENGNVYRIIHGGHDSDDGSDSVDGEVEEVRVSSEAQSEEDGESSHRSDDQRESRRNETNYEKRRDDDHGENESFLFSPPLPVKMESMADLMNKRKSVKFVD